MFNLHSESNNLKLNEVFVNAKASISSSGDPNQHSFRIDLTILFFAGLFGFFTPALTISLIPNIFTNYKLPRPIHGVII